MVDTFCGSNFHLLIRLRSLGLGRNEIKPWFPTISTWQIISEKIMRYLMVASSSSKEFLNLSYLRHDIKYVVGTYLHYTRILHDSPKDSTCKTFVNDGVHAAITIYPW